MAMTLAEIRAKLQANENRGSGGKSQGDNAIYAHWNIPENTTSRVRFLPDANTKNSFFWVERAMIRLPFAGIKGQSDSKPVTVQVPCMEMWGEACPILAEVRPWFKDPNLENWAASTGRNAVTCSKVLFATTPLVTTRHQRIQFVDSSSAHRSLT